jgi:3-isopropylmalate dehydrogenase
MSSYTISVVPGDGIGPEVIAGTLDVLQAAGERFGLSFATPHYDVGGIAIDRHDDPLPAASLAGIQASDALLFGSIGGPKWDNCPQDKRPEAGLLRLRKELGAFANLRPAVVFDELVEASTLKPEVVRGTDIMVVRELTGGIYFGGPRASEGTAPERRGYNTMVYTEGEIRRILEVAFTTAQARSKRLCSVDKANVLEVSRLWRAIADEMASDYPDVELSHMYVDNAAMQLIRDPKQFDTIVTGNLFGDILSDAASQLTGSIGMLASASSGGPVAMYEPIHGSAPDIAGQDRANPLATIASLAMLLRYSLQENAAANAVEQAIRQVLQDGLRTGDLTSVKESALGTQAMAAAVAKRVSTSSA